MLRTRVVTLFAASVVASLPTAVGAHFKLLEPTSWVVENNLGDPQKAAPCGNPPAPRAAVGQPAPPAPALEVTNAVGKVVGGSKLRLKVQETIYEADIQLPNITCAKCTLQVIQFMAEHAYNQPGGYSYHHCADLAITADPSKPIDKGWPVGK
jgi:hypothetical protein